MVDRASFINEWSERAANGSASVFVGAGTSMGAGYPSWRKLLRRIAGELGLDIEQEHDLAAVAQHYINRNRGKGRLTQAIAGEFPRKPVPPVLRVLARLPLRRIWTTNWDELIETALVDARREPDVKERTGDLTYERSETDVTVYKMHGSIRHLDDIVLATDDFELFRIKREAFLRVLAGHLISTSFLFIGVSFADPNLSHLLGGIREMYQRYAPEGHGQTHYAILRRPHKADYDGRENAESKFKTATVRHNLFVEDLKRYNIHCLEIDTHEELEGVLVEVEQRIARRAVFVSGSLAEGALAAGDHAKVVCIAREVGRVVGETGKHLVSGYGLGIGDHVLSGMLNAGWLNASSSLGRRITIQPFPQQVPPDIDRGVFYRQYREDLIARAGICIPVCGIRVRPGESGVYESAAGVKEEAAIAQAMGRIVIPVAASLGAAAELAAEQVSRQVAYPAELPQDAIAVLADATATIEAIGRALGALLRAV